LTAVAKLKARSPHEATRPAANRLAHGREERRKLQKGRSREPEGARGVKTNHEIEI